MAVLLPNGRMYYTTNAGLPLVGGKVFTYDTGTNNPKQTTSDAAGLVPNTNPVVLDARGEATIFWNGAYRVQVQDSLGNIIIPAIDGISTALNIVGSLIPPVDNSFSLGSSSFSWANLFLGVNHAPVLDTVSGNVGYYARTAAEITAGITPLNFSWPPLNVRRYGALLNATWNGTIASGTDDSTAFANAVSVAAVNGGEVTFDGPTIIKNVALKANVNIRGVGYPTIYVNATAAADVAFNGVGVVGTPVAITAPVAQGAYSVNVANTSTFTVGMWVVVQTTLTAVPTDYLFYGGAPNYPTSNGRKQDLNRVIGIVPNTSLQLENGLLEPYPSAQVCPMPGIISNFILSGFSIQIAIGNNGGGMQLWYCADFRVRDIKVIGASGYPSVRIIQSAFGDVSYCTFRDCQQVGGGLSTGISSDVIESSHNILFHHNFVAYFTEDEIGMRVRICQFTDNVYRNAYDSAINTHGNGSTDILIADNLIDSCEAAGIAVGYSSDRTNDSYVTIARNRIINNGGKPISVASANTTYTVTNVTQAASAVFTINTISATNPMSVGQGVSLTAVVGMTQINSLQSIITAVGGVSGAWTATIGINSTAFTAYASGGVANVNFCHQYIRIIDNDIRAFKMLPAGTTPGIFCQYVNDLEVSGNTIDGTTVVNAPDAGISIQNSTKVVVRQNRVRNCTLGYGIQLTSCTDYDAADNLLYNNQNSCNTSFDSGFSQLHDNVASPTTNSIATTTKSWGNSWDFNQLFATVVVPYSASMTFDASAGNRFQITVTTAAAFTINAPTNPPAASPTQGSGRITVTILNSSGGAHGAITWNAVFKVNATALAVGTGNNRSIEFLWNGTNWVECVRSVGDVPN